MCDENFERHRRDVRFIVVSRRGIMNVSRRGIMRQGVPYGDISRSVLVPTQGQKWYFSVA
jgi:hypothetical protein